LNHCNEEVEVIKDVIHIRDAQFFQVSSEKAYFVNRLHELIKKKKRLTTDLQQAKQNIYLLKRKCDSLVSCYKVMPDNNLESDGVTATIKDERYALFKVG